MKQFGEDDFRAGLAWFKALVTSDTQGQRAITRSVDPARLVDGITCVAAALHVDSRNPVGWADRSFDRISEITAIAETHRQRSERAGATAPTTIDPGSEMTAEQHPPTAPAATPQPEKETPPMTVTCTLPLDDQLSALARIHSFDPSYVVNSRHSFSPGEGLRELVSLLRKVGIEPGDAAAYDALATVELSEPAALAGRRLDLTPDAFVARFRDAALYNLLYQGARRHMGLERDALRNELYRSMVAEADDYIDALRPAFNAAIADVRTVTDLGLTGPEQAIGVGPDAGAAWLRMKSMARVLDGIAGIRLRLSSALGIEPINRDTSGHPIRFGVCFGVGVEFDRDQFRDNSDWQRWMRIAATGTARLGSVTEVDTLVARQRASMYALVPSVATAEVVDPIVSSAPGF